MSDDTPTQKFPGQDGNTPTERVATGEVYEELGEERQKSRGLLVGLIIAGALLLIAIVVILFVVLGKNAGQTDQDALPTPITSDSASPQPTVSDTPSAAATPTPSPSETQDAPPPPPPPSTAVAIDSFTTPNKTVFCNTQSPVPSNQYISFAWKTSNADSIKLGTYDPYGDYEDMYYNLSPDGNTNDAGLQITYFCPEPTQKWRLTVTGNGQTVTKEIKFTNNGDTQ
jgi:flagellar basal body-associated protein FliL